MFSRVGLLESRVSLGAGVALGLSVLAGDPAWLQAQREADAHQGPSWALEGLRNVQCVRFLIEPHAASEAVWDDYRPIRADQDPSLHPALRGVIGNQPEFASWTASALCFFYVDTIVVGERTIARKSTRKPPTIAVWTLATAEQGGSRRDIILDLSTNETRVIRASEAHKLRIREVESTVSTAPESTDELHVVKMRKTRLTWTGRAAGDSLGVESPIEESWRLKVTAGTQWNVRQILSPYWTRPLVGFLRVEGKGDLAKALKASPIRFVGPRYAGGRADLHLSR